RPGLVDGQAATAQLRLVQLGNRPLSFLVGAHFDEGKASRAARHLVAHDPHRFNGAGLREQVLEIVLGGVGRKVSDKQFSTHHLPHCRLTCGLISIRCGCHSWNAGSLLDFGRSESGKNLVRPENAEYLAESRKGAYHGSRKAAQCAASGVNEPHCASACRTSVVTSS